MNHIVDSTVQTPTWHATANVMALIVAMAVLSAMGISVAVQAQTIMGTFIAAVAGMAGIAAAVATHPRALAYATAR